jgi:short-subunit dehydrogenase
MRVVVTGASSGIGRAIALACARRGDAVVCSARSEPDLAALAKEGGDNIVTCAGDVTREEDRVRLVEVAGDIDVLVNNAGRGYYSDFRDVDVRELEQLIALNVIAPVRLTQLSLPALERSRGVIVMMSSVAGVVAAPKFAAYSATKFALEGIAMALRAEVAAAGIAVVVVRPGPVDTPFRANAFTRSHEPRAEPPGSKKQTPEEVARRTLAAIAHRRPVVETSAFVRVASFGARVVPPIFRAVARRIAKS